VRRWPSDAAANPLFEGNWVLLDVLMSQILTRLPSAGSAALPLTFKAAVRVQVAVGLNVTLMLQLAPAAKELAHMWV
jgi:hypothetical protein